MRKPVFLYWDADDGDGPQQRHGAEDRRHDQGVDLVEIDAQVRCGDDRPPRAENRYIMATLVS